jgi:hypothetical protein
MPGYRCAASGLWALAVLLINVDSNRIPVIPAHAGIQCSACDIE